jgi:leucyl-tRNA---protein transferase
MVPVVATFIVYDELDRCPYLAGHVARLPLRVPARPLTRAEVDAALAAGDRRQGVFLYRPTCPACRACEPIRIPVADFAPSTTHRRTLRLGDAAFRLEIARPTADEQRATLYARHKWGRGLTTADDQEETTDVETYAAFLVETCCESVEFSLWDGDRLVSVAVADRGERSLSAVYCCFDPAYARYSPRYR